MMKRYEHWCSLDGGGMGEPAETVAGDWVRYEDALAAVAAERERCAKLCEDRAGWEDLNPAEALRDVAASIRWPNVAIEPRR